MQFLQLYGTSYFSVRITPTGQKLPIGTLREWHWRAMAEAWKARPAGIKDENGYYGHISWNTWLRLMDYKAGALVEEYQTWGERLPHMSATPQIYWIRLSPFGEQFYCDNWQRYHEMYPEVDAPTPDDHKESE